MGCHRKSQRILLNDCHCEVASVIARCRPSLRGTKQSFNVRHCEERSNPYTPYYYMQGIASFLAMTAWGNDSVGQCQRGQLQQKKPLSLESGFIIYLIIVFIILQNFLVLLVFYHLLFSKDHKKLQMQQI